MNKMSEKYKCPECGHPQSCPCPPCQAKNKTEKPWIWLSDNKSIMCSGCGLTESYDWWEEKAYESFSNEKSKVKE
jgi:hypothetical protein